MKIQIHIPKEKIKHKSALCLLVLGRKSGPMKDKRKKRLDRKSWKKDLEEQ